MLFFSLLFGYSPVKSGFVFVWQLNVIDFPVARLGKIINRNAMTGADIGGQRTKVELGKWMENWIKKKKKMENMVVSVWWAGWPGEAGVLFGYSIKVEVLCGHSSVWQTATSRRFAMLSLKRYFDGIVDWEKENRPFSSNRTIKSNILDLN